MKHTRKIPRRKLWTRNRNAARFTLSWNKWGEWYDLRDKVRMKATQRSRCVALSTRRTAVVASPSIPRYDNCRAVHCTSSRVYKMV